MVLILLQWVLCLFVALPLSGLLLPWEEEGERIGTVPERLVVRVLAGILVVTAVAELMSFFMPLSRGALPVLVLLAAVPAIRYGRKVWEPITAFMRSLRKAGPGDWLVAALPLAFPLLQVCIPGEVVDEWGYHLPYIRWLEEYPLPPGIAHIEDRMGFHPVKYSLDAVLSLRWAFAPGVYGLNGLLYILVTISFLHGALRLLRGRRDTAVADSIGLLALAFTWRIELTSVDADILNIYGSLFLGMALMRRFERGDAGPCTPWVIIWVLLLANKFIAVLLIPLLLVSCGRDLLPLVRTGRLRFLLAGYLALWVARSVWISGYAVYPLYFIDLFPVDWKLPLDIVRGQYHYVGHYARMSMFMPSSAYIQLRGGPEVATWLPVWWSHICRLGSAWYACGGGVLSLVFLGWMALRRRSVLPQGSYALVWALVGILVVWFLQAPALRFAWFAWLILAALGFATVSRVSERRFRIAVYLVLGFALIHQAIYLKEAWSKLPPLQDIAWHPLPRRTPETDAAKLGGIPVRIARDHDCGGVSPPCLPADHDPGLQFRGPRVEDGFRSDW